MTTNKSKTPNPLSITTMIRSYCIKRGWLHLKTIRLYYPKWCRLHIMSSQYGYITIITLGVYICTINLTEVDYHLKRVCFLYVLQL